MEIDYERLRRDLLDYYGTATMYEPVAIMDVLRIESASHNELLAIAESNNIDLSYYQRGFYRKK